MPVYEPETFVKALNRLGGGPDSPFSHLLNARVNLSGADLPMLALGVAGLVFVKDEYDDAQRFYHSQLAVACDNFHGVLQGLLLVAKNYQTVEKANLVNPGFAHDQPNDKIDLTPFDFDSPDAWLGRDLIVLGSSWTLGVVSLFIGATLEKSGQISAAAAVSTALWAMFTPMDTELSAAQDKWESAAEHLNQFGLKLIRIMTEFGQAWHSSKGSDAFRDYMDQLSGEVREAAQLITNTASTLKSIHDHLFRIQMTWAAYTLAVLMFLILLKAFAVAAPPSSGWVKVVIELVGGTVTKAVGYWVGLVGEAARALILSAGVIPFSQREFVVEKKPWSYGGTQYDGLDLKSVRMSRNDLDALVQER
ncbi:WXG100 family type VII secretion target [Actinopolymorpha pittospori]